MNVGDPRLRILILLCKLEVLGMRKVSWSYGQMLLQPNGPKPEPCIELAMVSLSKDFIQFVPIKKADKDYKPWQGPHDV